MRNYHGRSGMDGVTGDRLDAFLLDGDAEDRPGAEFVPGVIGIRITQLLLSSLSRVMKSCLLRRSPRSQRDDGFGGQQHTAKSHE